MSETKPGQLLTLKSFADIKKDKNVVALSSEENLPPVFGSTTYLGCPLPYKVIYKSTLFQVGSMLKMLNVIFPTKESLSACTKLRNEFIKPKHCKSGFVSWTHLKSRINQHLYSVSLRDVLRHYVPFEPFSLDSKKFGSRSLKKDHIKVFGQELGFIVVRGKLFFEVLSVFTVLGELGIAMQNKWAKVDEILQESGLNQRETFKKRNQTSWSDRSHVSCEAILILLQKGFLKQKLRESTLLPMFIHLENELSLLEQKKENLILHLDLIGRHTSTIDKLEPKSRSKKGANELIPCCPVEHIARVSGRQIVFVFIGERIFLQIDEILSVLGNVDAKSGYNYVEKTLVANHFGLKKNFLSSKKIRTHISLEAALLLAHLNIMGKDDIEPVRKDLKHINEKFVELRNECGRRTKSELKINSAPPPRHSKLEDEVHMCSSGKFVKVPDSIQKVFGDQSHFALARIEALSTESCPHTDDSIRLEGLLHLIRAGIFADSFQAEELNAIELESIVKKEPKKRGRKKKCSNDNICTPIVSDTAWKHTEPAVSLFDEAVPYIFKGSKMYLDEKVLTNFLSPEYALQTLSKQVKRLQSNGTMETSETTVFVNQKKRYLSLGALKILVNEGVIGHSQGKEHFIQRVDEIGKDAVRFRGKRQIDLGVFGPVSFVEKSSKLFLHTMQIFSIVGFSHSYLEDKTKNMYALLNKLLKMRGLNRNQCFLKRGKLKYIYISMESFLRLLHSKCGPFKDVEKMQHIRRELINAAKGIKIDFVDKQVPVTKISTEFEDSLLIGTLFPHIPYKVDNGTVFVHRKLCFEACGLEETVIGGDRGFNPINDILVKCGHKIESVFLRDKAEEYSFISLPALIDLLESQDPLVNCLEDKDAFLEAIWSFLQFGASRNMENNQPEKDKIIQLAGLDKSIPVIVSGNRIFLQSQLAFKLSGFQDSTAQTFACDLINDPIAVLKDKGMDLSKCFFHTNGDPFSFIAVDALQMVLNLKAEYFFNEKAIELWKDLLTAVISEAPRLKIRLKMVSFRTSLIAVLMENFKNYLEVNHQSRGLVQFESHDGSQNEPFDMDIDLTSPTGTLVSETFQQLTSDEESTAVDPSLSLFQLDRRMSTSTTVRTSSESSTMSSGSNSTNGDGENYDISPLDFNLLLESLQTKSDGCQMIGEWQVIEWNANKIQIFLPPGSSASKKSSFINPDVRAIVCYELSMSPGCVPRLNVNNLVAPVEAVYGVIEKSIDKGVLNLLLNLHSIRPCFGSYCPELIETLEKKVAKDCDIWKDIYVDKTFVGSSQNGKVYAGTVRSKKCKVLAKSRVSDACEECSLLQQLAVNRSVLKKDTETAPSNSSGAAATTMNKSGVHHQESVWKVSETGVNGCTFVCPQLQSFNTGLSMLLDGIQQASAIIEHKVTLSKDLKATFFLNEREIEKRFPDFEEKKQVGPLLEWMASHRMCVGFPHQTLVDYVNFIVANFHSLRPDIQKYFSNIIVDETFKFEMKSTGPLMGTVRTPTCRFVAEDNADICEQCFLLKEPIDFLCPKSKRK